MRTFAIFVTSGRNYGRSAHDYQATALNEFRTHDQSSYSGLTREEAIQWLEETPWGRLGYDPGQDGRYSIDLEHTGRSFPEYVVRFCDNWIGLTAETRPEAERMRDDYAMARRWTNLYPDLRPRTLTGDHVYDRA